MKTQLTVDTGGRVLVPKELRDRLGVGPGDVLELSEASELITLKPVRHSMPLEKRHGFWVYAGKVQAGKGGSNAETLIADDREARAEALPLRRRQGKTTVVTLSERVF